MVHSVLITFIVLSSSDYNSTSADIIGQLRLAHAVQNNAVHGRDYCSASLLSVQKVLLIGGLWVGAS